jgi:hypothetical protein
VTGRDERIDDVLLAAAVRSWDAEVKNFDRYMTRVNLTITIGLALAALRERASSMRSVAPGARRCF